MRSLRAALAASLAALALLAGCSDDDPSPGDPPSTGTPTGTPETPETPTSSAAPPTEPVLPDAATKATEDGARAFITYYFDLVSHAQVSGEVKALRRVSGPNCKGCNAGIAGVTKHYKGGGRIIGGALTPVVDRLREVSTKSGSLFGFHAVVTTTHDEQTIIESDGSSDTRSPGTDRWNLYLIWTPEQTWRLDVMDLK